MQLWETIESRDLVVAEPWLTVSALAVRLPNGNIIHDYHQIRLPEFIIVFAQTVEEKVIIERQYKHGAGRVSLTLPAGGIEDLEEPLAAAQRELMEETGYRADTWQDLGSFVVHGNYGCGTAHMFKATGAIKVAEPDSGDLEEMEILLMAVTEVVDAVRQGDVVLLGSAAAIALATNPLISCDKSGKLSGTT